MIMKAKKGYSWVIRISNSLTEEVEYHTLMYLTATEAEHVAETIKSFSEDLCVSVFKLHKTY